MTDEKPRASEFEYLIWFRCNADFGPSHMDVINWLNKKFEDDTGLRLPKKWELEE